MRKQRKEKKKKTLVDCLFDRSKLLIGSKGVFKGDEFSSCTLTISFFSFVEPEGNEE